MPPFDFGESKPAPELIPHRSELGASVPDDTYVKLPWIEFTADANDLFEEFMTTYGEAPNWIRNPFRDQPQANPFIKEPMPFASNESN